MNGTDESTDADDHGYLTVTRVWTDGDEVVLHLPMSPRRIRRERQAVGVQVGPLVMVATPGEVWRPVPDARGLGEWEVFPQRSWNFALYPDAPVPLEEWVIERRPVGNVPFDRHEFPVVVRAAGIRVHTAWTRDGANASNPPSGPAPAQWINPIDLVPYGSARIRIAEFPTVRPVVGVALPAAFRR